MTTYDKKIYEILGRKFKELRLSKKLSQEFVGNKVGVTKKTISKYEQGAHRIDVETIKKMSSILGVDHNLLMKEVSIEFDAFNELDIIESPQKIARSFIENPVISTYGHYNLEALCDDDKNLLADKVLETISFFSSKYTD